jgi:hypothetical protein
MMSAAVAIRRLVSTAQGSMRCRLLTESYLSSVRTAAGCDCPSYALWRLARGRGA